MKSVLLLLTILIFGSCNKKKILTNKKISFLFLKQTKLEYKDVNFNELQLDTVFLKTISPQEKAILSLISLRIGNDCNWDGVPNSNADNMNCLITKALGLGYVCGDQNLNYLKKWFAKDTSALVLIDGCKQFPMGSKLSTTFTSIDFTVKNDTVFLVSKASAVLMDDKPESWEWKENYSFSISKNSITLISKNTIKL